MRETLALTRKELNSYFSSLMAVIFVGIFLAATLFTFFWLEKFFARNIADVRPLFQQLPVLLIFLSGALTMRQWSEEEQTGTLELLLILPVRLWQLVLGKFLAAMVLIAIALVLTVGLPISVSFLGDIDPGPTAGGYLAALLLASTYVAIGLFVSSRTSNQIVALMVTVVICGVLHFIGTVEFTEFTGSATVTELMRAISTSSRFESIERGVLDIRDLLYYLTITGAFLTLNVLSLDSKRWSNGESTLLYRFNTGLGTLLIVANLILVNVWAYPFNNVRLDLTEDQEYTLSDVTRDLLQNLNEPLIVTAYLSEENHPWLEPLMPRLTDTLEEYEIAADGNMELEIVDPADDPEIEQEASEIYGIRPLSVQDTTDRLRGTAVLNVYFHVLIRYGDQSEVLDFRNLIEVEPDVDGDVTLRFRNLEYDLTSTIKTVVSGFQSVDSALAALSSPATLTLYTTPSTTPESLADVPDMIESIATELGSSGQLTFQTVNVNDPESGVDPERLYQQYGIAPYAADILGLQEFYMHMVLETDTEGVPIFLPNEITDTELQASIEAAIKRVSPGFLPVVGIWTPSPEAQVTDMFGQPTQTLEQYQFLPEALREAYDVRTIDLSSGQVPVDVDVMLVITPSGLGDIERYALDQYLMRGGTLVVATSAYQLVLDQQNQWFGLSPIQSGIQEMLASYGVTVEQALVLDPQSLPVELSVQRVIGNTQVIERRLLDYPYFIDVRPNGMDQDSLIVADLPAVGLNWASPITLDETLNEGRSVSRLLRSTGDAWTDEMAFNIRPTADGGFTAQGERQSHTLAVAIQGQFQSFFTDKPSPFEADEGETSEDEATEDETAPEQPAFGLIEESPDSARLVVIGSSAFLNDVVVRNTSDYVAERFASNIQLIQNTIDWSVEDTDLLSIRSRGTTVRLLDPIDDDEKTAWEIGNYVLALAGLLSLAVVWQVLKRSELPMVLVYEEEEDDDE